MISLRTVKKSMLMLLSLFLALTLILVMTLGLLVGTEKGRLFAVAQALKLTQGTALSVKIDGLETKKLGFWRFRDILVQRQGEPWIALQNGELRWFPQSLFKAVIKIEKLSVQDIYFNTALAAGEPEKKLQAKEKSAPKIPALPTISIQQLTVDHLDIDGLVLPRQTILPDYRIEGSARLFDAHPILLDLNVASLGDIKSALFVNTLIEDAQTVKLVGQLDESPGGLIHTLLHLPAEQAVDANFDIHIAQLQTHIEIGVNALSLPLSTYQIKNHGTLQLKTQPLSIDIPAWQLQTNDKKHSFKGGYNPQDLWAALNLSDFPLNIAAPWVEGLEEGALSAQVDLSWIHSQEKRLPTMNGSIDMHSRYQQVAVSAKGLIDFAYPTLTMEETQLRVGDMLAETNGTLDLENKLNALHIQIRNLNTKPLKKLKLPIPDYLQAEAKHVKGFLRGSLKEPLLELATQASGRVYNTPFKLDLDIHATTKDAAIKNLKIEAHDALITTQGKVDWSSSNNNFNITYRNLNDRFIGLAQQFSDFSFPADVHLSADGETTLAGSLKQPKLKTNTAVNGSYQRQGEDLPFKLLIDGRVEIGNIQTLTAELNTVELTLLEKKTLIAHGVFNSQKMDLHVQLDRMPTQALSILGLPNIQGKAQADMALTGSLEEPNINGFFEYEENIKSGKRTINLNWLARFTTDVERQLSIQSIVKQNQAPTGKMTIELPLDNYLNSLRQGNTVQLRGSIQGTQDLRIARWFIDPLTHPLGGKLKANLTLAGTKEDPKANGTLSVLEGHYANVGTGVQLDQIDAQFVVEGKNLSIEKAVARTGGDGTLALSGQVHLAKKALLNPNPIRLQLRAQNATVVERPGLQVQLSGETTVEGNLEDIWVKGALDFTPIKINIDQLGGSSIPEIKITEMDDPANPTQEKTQLPTVHLDLTLTAEQQAFIRGRGLDAELGGRIRVTGDLKNPQYVGRFETRRGKMDLLTRRFILEKGDVRFSNDAIAMRIPAVYTSKEIKIRLELYGSPEAPQLKLSSIPDLPQDEILSRLIFGESVAAVTPFQAIRLAAAARTLSQGGGFDPIDKTRSKLGLDSISVENETLEDGESGVAVGVGKYINEKVYVELERSPNPSQPWNASVEIELTSKIRLESTTGTRGKVNTKLLWTNDY